MRSWISARMLGCALALAGLTALPVSAEPAAKIAEESDALEEWRNRVVEARDRVRNAHAELASAEYEYSNWRQRKLPRGKPKGEIVARIDSAEKEVAAAEAALPGVVEEARRAGLLPGDFRALDVEP